MSEKLDELIRRVERLERHAGLPSPEPARARPSLVERWTYALAAAQAAATVLAMLACWAKVETVTVTAPAVSLLGMGVALGGWRRKSTRAVVFGLSAAWVSVLGFVMIVTAEWSPRQAHAPLAALATFYALTVVPAAAYALLRKARLIAEAGQDAIQPDRVMPNWNAREPRVPSVAIRCE
jgi:hypothetical protein